MSYQVLARKWRPRTFASLIGQEHVVRALTHALTEGRLHHAYLLTGTRGVGKTTLARILAKSLNCETGVSATPCGACAACGEIDAGRFVDLLEVDAATNTRVDEMRQLLENAVYAPTRGRFKVYVIDEVHMLSTSAFNAMLKTLEEPPAHVKFILATTDPQKIPVTVLSRCLQFNLKQITPPLIAAHLKHILDVEAVSAEVGALNLLARSAAGSMRDALSLLDQAIAHGAGRVEEAPVREMLGAVDLDHLFTIVDALLAGDAEALLRVADAMAARSLSFDAALQEMASLLTRLQIAQLAPQSIADDTPERERLLALADRFDPEFVQLAYQIVVHGRKELPLAPDQQAGFVMTLLRLHAFRPLDDDLHAHAVGGGTGVRETRGVPPKAEVVRSPVTPIEQRAVAPARAAERKPIAGVDASQQSVAVAPGIATVSMSSRKQAVASDWHTLLSELKLTGMARELGQHCALRDRPADDDRGEERFVLCLSPVHRHLLIKAAQDKLQQALTDYCRKPVSLAIELDAGAGDTPVAAMRRDRQARMDQAVASVEQDGFVREIIEIFDATLVESSIQPV